MTPQRSPEPVRHERLYRAMRGRIMLGELPPGQALTLRGIAAGRDEPVPSTIEDPAVLDALGPILRS